MFLTAEFPTPCTTVEQELWYSRDPIDQERAKKLCLTCPLREPCLQSALDYEELAGESLAGVFGALSQQDRQQQANRRG